MLIAAGKGRAGAMPAVTLCRQRTHVASDDIAFIALLLAVVHATWSALVPTHLHDVADCPAARTRSLKAFAVLALATHLLNATSELILAVVSSCGTPLEPSRRSAVPTLFSARVALLALDLTSTLLGSLVLRTRKAQRCLDPSSERAAEAIAFGNWAVLCLFFLILALAVVPSLRFRIKTSGSARKGQHTRFSTSESDLDGDYELHHCLSFLPGNAYNADARPAADAMARGFPRGLDLTFSDTIAALALLGLEQEDMIQALSRTAAQDRFDGVVRDERGKCMDVNSTRMHLQNAVRMCKYSLAAYGWPLFCYSKPGRSASKCCCMCAPGAACSDRSAAASFIGCSEDDVQVHAPEGGVQYVSTTTSAGEPVIALRGTLSIGDVLKDFDYAAEPMTAAELRPLQLEEGWAHRGMLFAARTVYRRLVLEVDNFRKDGSCRRVHVVGHSLGAGVASLLSIFLKGDGWDVNAVLYAPPGACVSSAVADAMASFAVGIFIHSDFITRLSPSNFELLRRRMLGSLARCRVNKQWLFLRLALQRLWPLRARDVLLGSEEVSDEARDRRDDALAVLMEVPLERSSVPLWPPGLSLNMVRLASGSTRRGLANRVAGQYWPRWEGQEARDEHGMEVSPNMFRDHFPERLESVLQQLAEELGEDEKRCGGYGGVREGEDMGKRYDERLL